MVSCGGYKTVKPIKTPVPPRPAGQENALLLRRPPLDTVRVAFVGLGQHGRHAVKHWANIPGTKIVALCDMRDKYMASLQEDLAKAGRPRAEEFIGDPDAWKTLCERDDINLIYIATGWTDHAPMAKYVLEHGKNAAVELPSAMTLDECWDLVNTVERTRMHCFMLENCCYDFFESTALNMAQQGVFGEVIHAEGSYFHYLSPEHYTTYYKNWRLEYNKDFAGDIYPTHGFGPICDVLNIHRGDRLKTLVAMDTKSWRGPEYWKYATGEDISEEEFKNGDVTSSMMTTENGKTILLRHNCFEPRPYMRSFQLTGTEGYAGYGAKYPDPVFRLDIGDKFSEEAWLKDNVSDDVELAHISSHNPLSPEITNALMDHYMDPVTREIKEKAKQMGGHGGMDHIMHYRLVYCLRNGLPLDIDIYDLAEWCCITELSRISIEHGNAPVEIPDFTRGDWKKVQGYHRYYAGE